jgi:TolA-binding protein
MKRRLQAMMYLGRAFAKKGWHRQAADTYTKALESEPSEDRAKELHYLLGNAMEAMGEDAGAMEQYSHVAQMDFTFRDVRDRIEALRKKLDQAGV